MGYPFAGTVHAFEIILVEKSSGAGLAPHMHPLHSENCSGDLLDWLERAATERSSRIINVRFLPVAVEFCN